MARHFLLAGHIAGSRIAQSVVEAHLGTVGTSCTRAGSGSVPDGHLYRNGRHERSARIRLHQHAAGIHSAVAAVKVVHLKRKRRRDKCHHKSPSFKSAMFRGNGRASGWRAHVPSVPFSRSANSRSPCARTKGMSQAPNLISRRVTLTHRSEEREAHRITNPSRTHTQPVRHRRAQQRGRERGECLTIMTGTKKWHHVQCRRSCRPGFCLARRRRRRR